jgi:hypothetical protein
MGAQMTRHEARARAQRSLTRIRTRLARLNKAENKRDKITAERRAVYLKAKEKDPDSAATKAALKRYRDSLRLSHKIDETEKVLRKRAENKVKWLRDNPPISDPDNDGLITVDGKQVATQLGQEVLKIRKAGRWKGQVVSGYRTPEYSEQLCRNMCGKPSCPGLCAGRSTRHATKGGRNGAVDVSDYYTFAAECRRLGSWLENHLPRDLVHFSDIGN